VTLFSGIKVGKRSSRTQVALHASSTHSGPLPVPTPDLFLAREEVPYPPEFAEQGKREAAASIRSSQGTIGGQFWAPGSPDAVAKNTL
jgi:hypothetical protein